MYFIDKLCQIMIDTIHIELPYSKTPIWSRGKTVIDSITGKVRYETGYRYDIKIRVSNDIVRVEFSMPKLLKGNNVYMLSYQEVLESIQKAEEILQVSLREGIVRRIDMFFNIQTKYLPESYFRYLVASKKMNRGLVEQTSLYFKNNFRELYFYNKLVEVGKTALSIPFLDEVENLLRIEYRMKNRTINRIFEGLHVCDLFDKEIAIKLVSQLYEAYSDVLKEDKMSLIPIGATIDSPKLFVNNLASHAIKELGGVSAVFEMVDDIYKKQPCKHPEYISRIKKKIMDLASLDGVTKERDCIIELDSKVTEAYNTLIKSIRM